MRDKRGLPESRLRVKGLISKNSNPVSKFWAFGAAQAHSEVHKNSFTVVTFRWVLRQPVVMLDPLSSYGTYVVAPESSRFPRSDLVRSHDNLHLHYILASGAPGRLANI